MADSSMNGQPVPSFAEGEDIPPPFAETEGEPSQGTAAHSDHVERLAKALSESTFDGERGRKLLAELDERYDQSHLPDELKTKLILTPWSSLNETMRGGLWPGLHFLVGLTGGGKTQFALQIAFKAAQARIPVLYVALELGDLDLFARAVGILRPEAGKWSDFATGEKKASREILRDLDGLPFHSVVAPPMGWKHEELEPYAVAFKSLYPKAPTMLVVIDFAQLMGGKERELRERIGKVAYAARRIARDYNAVVLMISSTARDNYDLINQTDAPTNGKPKKKPWELPPDAFVGLGKESGEIEYSADSVMVLVKEQWSGETPPPGGTRFHLAVAKLRNGKPDWVDLCFNGSLFTGVPTGPRTLQTGEHDDSTPFRY